MNLKLRIPPPFKENIKKIKRQSKDWGKKFDKLLLLRIYKEFSNLNKKTNNLKIGKRVERILHQRNYTVVNKHMKRSSTLLDIREILIITTTYFLQWLKLNTLLTSHQYSSAEKQLDAQASSGLKQQVSRVFQKAGNMKWCWCICGETILSIHSW